MTKYIINGGNPLFGEVEISGAKNAAVAIIPAALMVDGVCRIENLPQISDVTTLLNILKQMGAVINVVNKRTIDIDCRTIGTTNATFDMVRKIRASYYLVGALLGRFGNAEVAMPGGCNFGGERPIDQHVKGFRALGSNVNVENGNVYADVVSGNRLRGASILFDCVSVGATINVMLAATLAEGLTVIENVAKEPHIVDVANFLNSMGADIRGAGTNVIKIRGVKRLKGGFYSIIPDQIEAGTYMAAVAGTGGSITIKDVIPKHLECIYGKLREMGVTVTEQEDSIIVARNSPLINTHIMTMPYPGFPTDMQPQLSAVLCLAEGTSTVTESVWENRFGYAGELVKMGASIRVIGRTAIIEGRKHITGSPIVAGDLRAGAALVIAALCARGQSALEGVSYVERGYEKMIGKLSALGADIKTQYIPESKISSIREVI